MPVVHRPVLVDWALLILLIKKHGATVERITEETGVGWKQQGRLARGEVHEPRFSAGVRLIDLAYDVLPADEFERVRK